MNWNKFVENSQVLDHHVGMDVFRSNCVGTVKKRKLICTLQICLFDSFFALPIPNHINNSQKRIRNSHIVMNEIIRKSHRLGSQTKKVG